MHRVVELAVGSYDDDGGTNAGAVHIIFLNSNGTVGNMTKISNSHGGLSSFYTLGLYDCFGSSLAAIGDLNSDGIGQE